MNKHFILFFLVSFISFNLWGYGDGKIHIEKQSQVLGLHEFATPGTKLRVEEVLVFIQIKIDMGGRFPKYYDDFRHQMLPFIFTSLDYGHRLFTHCGFNTSIKESLAIKDCFENMRYSTAVGDGGQPFPSDPRERLIFDLRLKSLKHERIAAGYSYLQRKKNEANREILEEIETQLGAYGEFSTAIATLIYDTHLIGDYASEKEGSALSGAATEALLPFDLLVEDIIKHSLENFDCIDGRGRKSRIIKETIQALQHSSKNGTTTKERAANVEAVLIKYIPRCIQNTRVLRKCIHGTSK